MTEVFSAYDIALTEEQMAKLCRYAALLVEWNEKMNLTAITDPEGVLVKHFLDSILPFSFVQLPQ
ncbi:MAG: class I SAM-dependent methyltransferase, partial [Oscillospiraceae bacterium]|nr:class I SAM-dependent methyltransferase [Oscillospiraceae bacterium]